jgi:hypothetical protein
MVVLFQFIPQWLYSPLLDPSRFFSFVILYILELLIRTLKVFGSNYSRETDCTGWNFSLCSSVPPQNAEVLAKFGFVASFKILPPILSTLLNVSLCNLGSYSELCY